MLSHYTMSTFNFKSLRFVLALGLSLALAGCAAPLQFNKQSVSKIRDGRVVLFVPQNALSVTVPQTNPGGGGLIGLLVASAIDGARERSATEKAAPVIEAARAVDFRELITKALESSLKSAARAKLTMEPVVESVISPSTRRIAFDKASGDAVALAEVRYTLLGGALQASLHVQVFPKTAELSALRARPDAGDPIAAGNAIYSTIYLFEKQDVTAQSIAGALKEAANSLAKQMLDDINHPG